MRAAVYRRTGPASEVLSVEEVATPEPGPGEVRVRIAVSGVNPTDWKQRSGVTAGTPDGFQIPHQDGAGVIDAVGQGVDPARIGERVWCYLAARDNRWGTAAQWSVLPADRAVPLPEGASFELGASIGVPAITAAHCLGQRAALESASVLVAGGAGAVGHAAIELARFAGARVAATASSPEKQELARNAGAALVVDYRDPGAARQLQTFSDRYDRVVEVALGANLDLDLAVSGPGTVITVYANEASDPVLPTRRLMTANVELSFVLVYGIRSSDLQAAVSFTRDALSAGALTTLPLHRFTLDQIAQAQDAVEAGVVGKVLVEID